jgi:hypothetical protein
MRPVMRPFSSGGPSSSAPGMQRATAWSSAMRRHTASRACGSVKLCIRRTPSPVSSSAPTVTLTGTRPGCARGSAMAATGIDAASAARACCAVACTCGAIVPGPGAGPSQDRAGADAASSARGAVLIVLSIADTIPM